jgi:hypothetical protein
LGIVGEKYPGANFTPAAGEKEKLHGLRQMRQSLPYRRGWNGGEKCRYRCQIMHPLHVLPLGLAGSMQFIRAVRFSVC